MGYLGLFIGRGIHEYEELTVIIQIFNRFLFQANIIPAVARIECHLQVSACSDIAHANANGRLAPAGFVVRILGYLVYLACFMLMAYLILFFSASTEPTEDVDEERILNALTVFSVLAFFIPNIGIMIRRRIGSWRVTYNYVVTALNVIISLGLIWFIADLPWQFK